jgi:hypothetical protein
MGTRTCVGLARRLVSLTLGAEDGIRTRDPDLGKVAVSVHGVAKSPDLRMRPSSFHQIHRIRPCRRAAYYENSGPG